MNDPQITDQPLPPDVQQTLDDAERLISDGETALIEALVGIHDNAHQLLDQSQAALMPVLDEYIGMVDNRVSAGEELVHKAVNSVIRAADDTLSNGYGQLAINGWRFPNQAAEQNVVLNGGTANYLPTMVPEFAALDQQLSDQTGDTRTQSNGTAQSPPPVSVMPSNGTVVVPVATPNGRGEISPACTAQGYFTGDCAPDQPGPDGMCHLSEFPGGPECVVPCCPDTGGPGVCYSSAAAAIASLPPGCEAFAAGIQANFDGLLPGQNIRVFVGCNVPGWIGYVDLCKPGTSPPVSPPVSPPFTPPTTCPPTLPPGCPQLPPVIINVPPCPTLPPSSPVPLSPPRPSSPPTTPDGGTNGNGGNGAVEPPDYTQDEWLFDWRDEHACDRVEKFITGDVGQQPTNGDGPVEQSWLGQAIEWATALSPSIPIDAATAAPGEITGTAVAGALTAVYAAGGEILNAFFAGFPVTGGAVTDSIIKLCTSLSISGWAQRLTGAPVEYLNTDTEYALRYISPQYIPDQSEVDELYKRSVIDRDTYICLTRAHGNHESWRLDSMTYKFARPTPGELSTLFRRREITPADWRERMRLHGFADDDDARLTELASRGVLDPRTILDAWRRDYIDPETRGRWLESAGLVDASMANALLRTMEVIPPYTDIIRMMVHDVEDDTVVSDYRLDTSFEDKYKGTLELWARQQGIPREAALYLWRSHWVYPSNTATYVMLHRLRRERPERLIWEANNPQIPGESDYSYFQRGPRVVTREVAKRLLSINDLAPTWVEPLLDISYNPITRTDAIRAFEIGAFTEDQLYNAYRDNGYNDTDANLLVRFEREQKSRRVANATGVLTIRKIVRYYKGGAMGRQEAERLLVPLMTNPDDRVMILDRADAELEAERREARIKRLKRQYMVGAIDDIMVAAELESIGATAYTAGELYARWVEERGGRLKEPTVRMLCGWYNHGFITIEDYRERLLRLGYDADDVLRISGVCDTDLRAKRATQAAKQLEDAQKKIDKLLRDNYDIFTADAKQLASNETQLANKLAKVRAEQERRRSGGPPREGGTSPPPPPPPPPPP